MKILKIKINNSIISNHSKTYFIADIAANHDGSLKRAKKLIRLAAESGANAAKFQNFYAETIVSDYGFKRLNKIKTHQSNWKKNVYDVYKDAETPLNWTSELKKTCKENSIDYFTAPYDIKMIKYLNQYVSAWKIGSGDITWHDSILKMAKTKKPVIIATGASTANEVDLIVKKVGKINKKIVLMQCNTNYTASDQNFKNINLEVINFYKKKYPNIILGLSDHTYGSETVIGAVTLGVRVVEKHFTDSNKRSGPDHLFSMNPKTWREMVLSCRRIEAALGDGIKKIENNEQQSSVVQRRAIRANKLIKKGEIIKKKDLVNLRPWPKNSLSPYEYKKILNKKAKKDINFHEIINLSNIK
jgi:sialic acid synthase SpsE|tara:strand:- start:3563 stop:4636 length:1074 start_codon:yes stop_codon:yes gene_type:complete